ncbi:MAG: acyl-phosphate glycerol 3-phosphate acyltransferase [Rickettsiales bacterium]|nr:acyl-phosphate glycerol 3-phosphate acyltransferase [Rickettsiales bacterium]|tara:strand:+ start:38780 stop:39355 length:576 start_codon:yes stop_codon:yes gene_type:complete
MFDLLFYLLSFLLGSLPTGFLLVKLFYEKDIRLQGSGNIGATNVWRNYGPFLGGSTFLIDALKSMIAIYLIGAVSHNNSCSFLFLVGSMALLGHIFSPWLNFKGGKGIATFFGLMLAWNQIVFIGMAITWGSVYLLTRQSFIAGLITTLFACISAIVFCLTLLVTLTSLALLLIIFWRHEQNITNYFRAKS